MLVSMIVFLPSVLAQQAEDLVKVDLVASTKAIEGGKPFEVAVRYRLAPEWHLYWINPGDSGIPPTLKWTLPTGFSANPARFPVPRKIPAEGGILSYGYSDEVVLLVEILPPADVTGTVKLGLDTSYLVCKELCLPGKASAKLEIAPGPEQKQEPESFALWHSRIPVETRARTMVGVQQNDGKIEQVNVTFDVTLPQNTKDPEFFPGPSDTVSFKDLKVDDSGEVQFNVVPLNKVSTLDETIMGVLAYTDATGARRGVELKTRLQVDAGK
jgi:thiol:disulfide interchange protein DsbD